MKDKVLKINIFQDDLFQSLARYNKKIKKIVKKFNFETCHWADPDQQRHLPLSRSWPNVDPIQLEDRWKLILYPPNYMSIFMIAKLYSDKNILVEDMPSGLGYMILYLHFMGFKRFSMIDNGRELPPGALGRVIKMFKLNCLVNDPLAQPTVINVCAHPFFIRRKKGNQIFLDAGNPDSFDREAEGYPGPKAELVMLYQSHGIPGNTKHLPDGWVPLAVDQDELMGAYCREDRYGEFYDKLERYGGPT